MHLARSFFLYSDWPLQGLPWSTGEGARLFLYRVRGSAFSSVRELLTVRRKKQNDDCDVTELVLGHGISASLVPKIPLVQKLRAVIDHDYPNGIVLNNSTIALLECSLGEKLSDAVVSLVKNVMFERSDGILLYREMVVDDSVMDLLVSRAREYLETDGFFSLDALQAEFDGAIRNLPDDGDFKKFFNYYVAEKVGGKVRGTKRRRMCFKASVSDEDCWRSVAELIRSKLFEAGDARSLDYLLLELPHLNREVVEHVAESEIDDVIVFDLEETKYIKLLEFYYLPEDFSDVLKTFIGETESQSAVVSITLLDEFLDSNYGEGFRISYGLEDDSVYKQVISKLVRDGYHEWTRDMFVNRSKKNSANVVEQFLRHHVGVFHEEDFFRFAEETRGMTNRGMLILTFLRRYCVRLSKEWWISESEFELQAELPIATLDLIAQSASEVLGSAPFKPVSHLPQSFFDSLPAFMLGGREQRWNQYLFVSVAVRKIKRVAIVNDDPSPYSVTAMIVPADQRGMKDVVAYVVNAASGYRFADADAMFGYLKENSIRLFRTDKLIEKIDQLMRT